MTVTTRGSGAVEKAQRRLALLKSINENPQSVALVL